MAARIACAVFVGWMLPACGTAQPKDVVLGAIVARTGDRALWGEDLYRGLQLAVDQWNVRGGLLGRHIRLAIEDDGSHDESAGPLVARLCDHDGALAVFGEVSTVASEHGAQAAHRRGVPFVGTANTLRDIARLGDSVFRTALTDSEQASAVARYVRTVLQRRRAAVLYRRSSLLDLTMADEFAQTFRTAGGDVPFRESFEGEDTEMARLATRIHAAGADVVFAPASSVDAARIAVALRHAHVTAQLVGTDGWLTPELRQLGADSVIGALIPEPFASTVERPEVEQFVQSYREKYHAMPGAFAALGFDAVRWVLTVASRAPSLDPHALRDALSGSRLDDAVAGPFAVDARRVLTRSIQVLRVDPDHETVIATAAP